MNAPTILSYAQPSTRNELRGQRTMRFFWLGILTGSVLAAAWILNDSTGRTLRESLIIVCLQTSVLGVLQLLMGTFGLGLALWIRQQRQPALHFRTPLAPFLCGILVGLAELTPIATNWISIIPLLVLSFSAAWVVSSSACPGESNLPHLTARFLRYWRVTALTILLLFATGYVSALTSRSACERRLAHYLADIELRGRPFKLRSNHMQDADRIFRDAGYSPPLAPDTITRDDYPFADIGNTCIDFPFLVSIDGGFIPFPNAGAGYQTVYLCFFGRTFELQHQLIWIS